MPYTNREWEKLSTAPKEDDLSKGILEAIVGLWLGN
jgi:hypothetical protein